MKAVVYSRVSTEEQNPRSQLEVVMDYARKRGYEIVKVFEENISGSINPLERPIFNQLLDFVRDNNTDVIVMYDLTRFYRPPPGQVAKALEATDRLYLSKFGVPPRLTRRIEDLAFTDELGKNIIFKALQDYFDHVIARCLEQGKTDKDTLKKCIKNKVKEKNKVIGIIIGYRVVEKSLEDPVFVRELKDLIKSLPINIQ